MENTHNVKELLNKRWFEIELFQVNFCENGGDELAQNGISLEKLSDTKIFSCENIIKEEEEEEEEVKNGLKEVMSSDMMREESDCEDKTERCALIRRSHSNSPEGPERLVWESDNERDRDSILDRSPILLVVIINRKKEQVLGCLTDGSKLWPKF